MMQDIRLDSQNVIQKIGNALYFMLIFVIMLDPTNSVFHLKDVIFVLLFGFNCLFFKPDLRYLPHILIIYVVVMLCYVLGAMQGSVVKEELIKGTIKGFAPLVLLLWTPYYNVLRLSKKPAIMVCTLIAMLYVLVSLSTAIELFVWHFVKSHNEMIMMTHRNFLGFKIFGMYYKSIISFIFILFLVYYKLYNVKTHRIRNFILVVIVSFGFLVSGTRATMLLPFFMLGLVMFRTFQKWKKAKYFLYPVLVVLGVLFALLILRLAMEKGEASNAIKYAHLTSYANLFESHPEYLIFGQGPGAYFYSEGFGDWASQTEWTYIELIRNYGIFSLGIIGVLLLPLLKLCVYRKHEVVFGVMGAYLGFLFIAGTNPLLISSTGMVVLLIIYSFVDIIEKNKEDLSLPGHTFLQKYF